MPERAMFRFIPAKDDTRAYFITMKVEDGAPVVDQFLAQRQSGSKEITTTELHSLPLGTFVKLAIQALVVPEWLTTLRDNAMERATEVDDEFMFSELHRLDGMQSTITSARRGRPVSDEVLRRVAEIHSSDTSGAPTQAVRNALNVSGRTAARYVSMARKRGFVPSATNRGTGA
jgi:hypothetical protein